MIALVQRVKRARVSVDGVETGAIGPGLLILLGIHVSDTKAELDWLVGKCARLRVFTDADGHMNDSLLDTGFEALVVSQFTLYGNTKKGNRPSFVEAAPPGLAEPLYEQFCQQLSRELNKPVPTGRFGAMMDVELVNDGPVTLHLEKRAG